MAKADLRVVQRWVGANPGSGLSGSDVPGSSPAERGALASLGKLAGTLLQEMKPGTADTEALLEFCDGNERVAAWFEGRDAPVAPEPVVAAARRLLLDDAEDGLARLYAGLVNPARRRRLGTFFTPQHEVNRMIASWQNQNLTPGSVVDVGAGVGIYTVASAQAWPTSEVFAVDVNPVTLGLLALRVASLEQDVAVTMVLSDFADWATAKWNDLPSPRLVLGNPPYTRMQLLPEAVRDDLVAKAGGLLGRRASLASILTVISLRLLGPEDGVCLLLPAQWLESDYALGMRKWLWDATDRRVELRLFSSALFKDAEVDAVSLLVGPRQSTTQQMTVTVDDTGAEDVVSRGEDLPARWRSLFTEATSEESTRACSERAAEATNEVCGSHRAAKTTNLDSAVGADGARSSVAGTIPGLYLAGTAGELLGDLATVKRGIATGANRFFVLSETQRKQWKIPKSAVVPVVRRLRTGDAARQNVWLHDPAGVTAGADRTVGEMSWLFVTGSKPTSINVQRYLEHGKTTGADGSVLAAQRPDWFDLTPLTRSVDVALSPMSKSVFRLLVLPQRTMILNNLYGLQWNSDVSADRRAAVLEYIASEMGQAQVRKLARSQASGLFKVEPRALAHLVVPAGE